MQKFILFISSLLLLLLLPACETPGSSNVVAAKSGMHLAGSTDVLSLGQPVDMSLMHFMQELVENPDQFVGQKITLKGTIDKVCKKKGCWADIVSGDDKVRIKVTDDEIKIPLYKMGKEVYATGVLKRYDMSLKQTIAHKRHMAKDAGEAFDPSSVTAGETIYQLQADALEIL